VTTAAPTPVSRTEDQVWIQGQLVYEYTARITDVADYGPSLADVFSGAICAPPEGVRSEVSFEGQVTGPRLRGAVKGVDYGNLRADGRAELHIHARITTEDGNHIALVADGVAVVEPGSPVAQLRENVTLTSSGPDHAWLNPLQVWGIGTVDFATGEIRVTAYTV
jgi:hypothetical protein